MQLDKLADMVVLTIKAALVPVLERMSAAEARLATLGDLRDRVIAVETKAPPPPVEPRPDEALLARVAALEALRDRVVVIETKSAMPTPSDPALSDLRDRVMEIEMRATSQSALELQKSNAATVVAAEMAALRDRLAGLETPAAPIVREAGLSAADVELTFRDRLEPLAREVAALRERLAVLETLETPEAPIVQAVGPSAADLELTFRDRLEPLARDLAAVRERLAVVETRAPVPGPAGKDGLSGIDGIDGAPGADGQDGLGFEDLAVDFDGDRTLALTFARGLAKKVFPITLPYLRYHGVYVDGKSYAAGDVVTWAGSSWHCNDATASKPGEGSKAWTLIVKRGRDGKDGRDGLDRTPVVSVGGRMTP